MGSIPFQIFKLDSLDNKNYPGAQGQAIWHTKDIDNIRIRQVEYSPGYLADHWCEKGHIVFCLEGSFITELSTGEKFTLYKGDVYVVSDGMSSHRSYSEHGVKLLIVDGAFLQ